MGDKIIIFVSHDMRVIKYISDEVLILDKEGKKIVKEEKFN